MDCASGIAPRSANVDAPSRPSPDGRTVVREKGDVHVRYGSSRASTLVIFGEPRDATLRSVLTPEELGFRVDPESRRLPENRVHPMVPVAGV